MCVFVLAVFHFLPLFRMDWCNPKDLHMRKHKPMRSIGLHGATTPHLSLRQAKWHQFEEENQNEGMINGLSGYKRLQRIGCDLVDHPAPHKNPQLMYWILLDQGMFIRACSNQPDPWQQSTTLVILACIILFDDHPHKVEVVVAQQSPLRSRTERAQTVSNIMMSSICTTTIPHATSWIPHRIGLFYEDFTGIRETKMVMMTCIEKWKTSLIWLTPNIVTLWPIYINLQGYTAPCLKDDITVYISRRICILEKAVVITSIIIIRKICSSIKGINKKSVDQPKPPTMMLFSR